MFERALAWSMRSRPRASVSYAIATAGIVALAVVRATLFADFAPWLLFTPGVLVIALLLGQRAGIYATLLSGVTAAWSIARPEEPLVLSPPQWLATGVFLLSTLGVVAVAAELRAAFRRMAAMLAERAAENATVVEREAFLASVLSSSTDCIKVLDLTGKLTFMSEGGMKVMEVGDFNAIAGCPWPDFWEGAGNVEAGAAIERARQGLPSRFTGSADTFAGNARAWDVAVSPIRGAEGAPVRILSVSRDITAVREQEQERTRLARIVENSADFIAMARLDGSVFFMNDAALRLVGLDRADMDRLTIADLFPEDEVAEVRNIVLPAVARDGGWSGERMLRHAHSGERIPVICTMFPVPDLDGRMIGYGTVTRDDREARALRQQQTLLNNELSHRLKNVLMVVQAVASQSLRQAVSLEEAGIAFSARLGALGAATDVLTATAWTAADLRALATTALSPHGAIGEQFRLAGPPVMLKPELVLAFALALHELATNATKYGALSAVGGHVVLSWSVTPPEPGEDPRLRLRWKEFGGPPVRPPSRKGFGSMMIERSLRSYFRGESIITYPPDGLQFDLDAPLKEAGVAIGVDAESWSPAVRASGSGRF